MRVRRARAKGTLSMLPASFMPHAKNQHRFIDSHPAEDLEFEGKLFYAPNPPFCQPNPALRYLGENMHCVRALDRILRQITRFFTCGFLRLYTREEIFSLDRRALMELLDMANFPKALHIKLPTSLCEIQEFVYRKLNTIHTKVYGDGATLVETMPTSMWSVGVLYFPWQFKV